MALNNQERTIEELYANMYYQLSAYAQIALNDRLLAEEAIQDTFRIACDKPDELLTSKNPKGWLVNTLKYVIKNMIRKRSHVDALMGTSIDLGEISFIDNTSNSYEDDIDLMYSDLVSNEDFKLLKKIVLEKNTMLEVAKELGISVVACRKRVERAKKNLQKYFKE